MKGLLILITRFSSAIRMQPIKQPIQPPTPKVPKPLRVTKAAGSKCRADVIEAWQVEALFGVLHFPFSSKYIGTCVSFSRLMCLSLYHHQYSTCADEGTAERRFPCKVLMQKHKSKNQRDDHAQLVDRYHLGRVADL